MLAAELLRDPLTGAYSRSVLQHRLHEEVERGLRYNLPFSILFLDIDHFKSINDAFGHTTGDLILVEFVNRLRKITRAPDILIRYGGDEFVILLPNTPKEQAALMAERLIKAVHSCPFDASPPLTASVSIGVASFPEDGQTPETLFEQTDLRQYEAKRRGRNQAVSETKNRSTLLPFNEFFRLVDRDQAINTANRFLNRLTDHGRGILLINGRNGSGRTRLLAEVGKSARLRGYEVINLRGNPALAARSYGVLLEGFDGWDLPSPYAGVQTFSEALQSILKDHDRLGLFIAADNIIDFDYATLELFHHLYVNRSISILGLAYTNSPDHCQRLFLPESPVTETIQVQPLSLEGIRIWLRSVLQWELPDPFISWIYKVTAGYPALIEKVITFALERGTIAKSDKSWSLDPHYFLIPIREELNLVDKPLQSMLPTHATSFVGREHEIQQVKSLLREKRLVTLIGPGGVGKTRLALQAACEMTEHFSQGVIFVPLASINSPQYLVPAIAAALKFSFFSQDAPEVQLLNYLHEKRLLLLLDNFEHLVDSSPFLSQIIEAAPHVHVLVTSRERLSIPGETSYELGGMGIPTGSLEAMEVFSSVQLFLLHARQVLPNFQLTQEDRPHIARICRLVEGIPLGIELAASWVKMFSCEEIADEIEKSLDFLVTEQRGVPERHRSLRGVFEHSWNLLSEQEKLVYSKLTVFMGSFRRETATEVAGAELPILSALLNKTLIFRTATGRYVLHEVLKQYAAEKLSEDNQLYLATCQSFCQYFSSFLESRLTDLQGKRQKEALSEIHSEINNIRFAWGYALEHGCVEMLTKASQPLWMYYEMSSQFQEGKDAFTDAVSIFQDKITAGISDQPSRDPVIGRLLLAKAIFHSKLSETKEAHQALNQAMPALEASRESALIARAALLEAVLFEESSDFPQAFASCRQSIDLCSQTGNDFGLVEGLTELGIIYWVTGEYIRAKEVFTDGLQLSRKQEIHWNLTRVLINLANVLGELGEHENALQLSTEALALAASMNDRLARSDLLNNMGDMEISRGNYDIALPMLEESLQLSEDAGDRFGMTTPLDNLADIAIIKGQYDRARFLLQKSLVISQSIGNADQTFTISHLGLLEMTCLQFTQARRTFALALEKALHFNTNPNSLEVIENIGEYLSAIDDLPASARCLAYIIKHSGTASWTRSRAAAHLTRWPHLAGLIEHQDESLPLLEINAVLVELKNLLAE